MNSSQAIGGDFCGKDNEPFLSEHGDHDRFFPERIQDSERRFFETGSDALAAILRPMKNLHSLWIPENFCMSGISRTQGKLGKKIGINTYAAMHEMNGRLKPEDALLFVHFNGFDQAGQEAARGIATMHRAALIEDFVQAPLDIASCKSSFAFNSLRKLAALELAVAYGGEKISPLPNRLSEYYVLKKKASEAKERYYLHPSPEQESIFLRLYREAEEALDRDQAIMPACESEIAELGRMELLKLKKIREANFQHLSEALSALGLRPLDGAYMYCMIRTPARDKLRAFCFKHGVFPAIHWMDSGSAVSRELLSFHVDQRFGREQMERILKTVRLYNSTTSSSL